MLGNDQSPMLRRAEAASSALDKAGSSGDPFAMLAATAAAARVVNELTERANTVHALSRFKAAQSHPMSVFEASPGAAPQPYPESSNAGSSPSGRPLVVGSAGSITSPQTFPQSYSAEERRTAVLNGQALPDGFARD
jgi:hypothetical protein